MVRTDEGQREASPAAAYFTNCPDAPMALSKAGRIDVSANFSWALSRLQMCSCTTAELWRWKTARLINAPDGMAGCMAKLFAIEKIRESECYPLGQSEGRELPIP
jgi:hypothetical protein